MPKTPNTLWTLILLALPAITLFVTGLNQSGLVAAGSLDGLLLVLATTLKFMEENKNLVASRSLAPDVVPMRRSLLLKRILLG